jgi:deoxyadenosine/deoxycytidine kinase
MIRIVVVAGRIGCGKSTLLQCLEREGYSVLPEPVEEWREKGWLKKFYENPKEKAFSFQVGVYNSAITNVQNKLATCKNPKGGVLFVERYIYDQLLFWHTQIESGRADDMDNEIYMGIWQRFRDYIPEPSGYILVVDHYPAGGGGKSSSPRDNPPTINPTTGGVKECGKPSSPHDNSPTPTTEGDDSSDDELVYDDVKEFKFKFNNIIPDTMVLDSFTQSMIDSGYLMNMPSCECNDSSSDDPPHTCEGRSCGKGGSPTVDPTNSFAQFMIESGQSTALHGIISRGRPEELKASKDGNLEAYQEILARKHMEFFECGRAHPPHAPPDGFPCLHLETRLYPYHKEKTKIVEIIEEWIEKINGRTIF